MSNVVGVTHTLRVSVILHWCNHITLPSHFPLVLKNRLNVCKATKNRAFVSKIICFSYFKPYREKWTVPTYLRCSLTVKSK